MSTTSLSNTRPSERPFFPEEKLKKAAGRSITRLVTAAIVSKVSPGGIDSAASKLFPQDEVTKHLVRAAVSPATTTATGWAAELSTTAVGEFVAGLVPESAAARLMALGTQTSLAGRNAVMLPRRVGLPATVPFVSEGGAIPVAQRNLTSVQLGPAKKLAIIVAFSGELARRSAIEEIVRVLLREDATASLDTAILSATAASGSRPAGILNGVTPLTVTAGGGVAALTEDVRALITAITDAGGGSSIVFVAGPARAATFALVAGSTGFPYQVIGTRAVAADALIAVDAGAFVSAFGPVPEIDLSGDGVIHQEDTTPLQIATAGTPNVVAAPTRSLFQTDTVGCRLILDCAWTMRAPHVAWIDEGLTW